MWIYRIPNWVLVIVRGAMALAAALLVVLGVVISLGEYREMPPWFPVTVAAIVAVGGLIPNLIGTYAAATATRRELRRERLQKASIAVAASAAEETDVNLLVVGVSVFKARGRVVGQRVLRKEEGERIWASPVRINYRLHRVLRFRLTDLPQPSAVKWTSPKGTIGECFEAKRWIHHDWSPIAREFNDAEVLSPNDFDNLDSGVRDGFEYKEFVEIMHKYAEILAVPIKSEGGRKVLGVLAVDRPLDQALTDPVLDKREIREAAEIAAAAIRKDVQKAAILEP